ncbi:MAG: imidazole glycerol phosphate synthase subunit HisF [Oscillospiraceae bacterium]|nr:imidazole glycerol phosphate synthase subunit HisF [Oscillospiraceae bacterium]
MSAKRIIPCLDTRNGRVVKGVKFDHIKEISDPVELAKRYSDEGADEIVLYDITASLENRTLFTDLLKQVAGVVSVPLAVGGGIAAISDVERMLSLGAGKVSINSGAIKNPGIILEAAKKYGSRCVVLAIDVAKDGDKYSIFTAGGKKNTGLDAVEWAKRGEANGAGELVVNSIDKDGVKNGFDLEMLTAVANAVKIPIVASGGAGGREDFFELFSELPVIDAGLAASIFHFNEVSIRDLKQYLREKGIPVQI